jgi:hypothetical protein
MVVIAYFLQIVKENSLNLLCFCCCVIPVPGQTTVSGIIRRAWYLALCLGYGGHEDIQDELISSARFQSVVRTL